MLFGLECKDVGVSRALLRVHVLNLNCIMDMGEEKKQRVLFL